MSEIRETPDRSPREDMLDAQSGPASSGLGVTAPGEGVVSDRMTAPIEVPPRSAHAAVTTSDQALLIDVRTRAEWRLVGVPDLANLFFLEWCDIDGQPNVGFLEELQHWVPRHLSVYMISRSGRRSRAAALAASENGYHRVYNVVDGFEGPLDERSRRGGRGWKAEGLPWRQW